MGKSQQISMRCSDFEDMVMAALAFRQLEKGLWRSIQFPPAKWTAILCSNIALEPRKVGCGSRRLRLVVDVRAYGDNGNEWESLEIAVPEDQRPANEFAALKEAALYSWAQLSPGQFFARLGGLWVLFFAFLSAPIAATSFDPFREPLKFFLAGGAGAMFAVAVLILRMYLGWSYVGDRLLSAVVAYEETGWYDGQLWVKPPEVLAHDRLLGSYQVKPIMNRLKQTLIGAGALLTAATATLLLLSSPNDSGTVFAPSTKNSSSSQASSDGKVGFRKKDLLSPPAEVGVDDELAAAAAAAAEGRPVYCTDRYYRALAGGQYCKWEDLRK